MWLPEKMNDACANKLLKLIEEPDPDTIFILVSNNAKEVLPTIFSRTQRIEMRKPSVQEIANYFHINLGTDYNEALVAASAADGDVMQTMQNMEASSETTEFHDKFVQLMRLAYSRNLKSLKHGARKLYL